MIMKSPIRGTVPLTPPCTTADRLQRIEAMSLRIVGYVQYMSQVGNLNGSSNEVKDKAVAAFYEQMVIMEHHLGKIQEGLKLD